MIIENAVINKPEDKVTFEIIECAMNVHSCLGCGFDEDIYIEALDKEMKNTCLTFERQIELPVYYGESEIGKKKIDFLVDKELLVEVKALSDLNEDNLMHGLKYLNVLRLHKGILINFGSKNLEVKKIRNPVYLKFQ